MYGNVHNIFIDHVEHSGESEQHHHHGPGDNDILYHKHDGSPNHNHNLDEIEYNDYDSADHTHDEPVVTEHIRPSTESEYDYNIDWADSIDNVTGGDPYGHNKS